MLDLRNRHKISSVQLIRLLNRFYKTCSAEEMDTVLKEWQEFKSLPADSLPRCESLEHLSSCIGKIPLPAGEVGEKRFGNLANFCKLLLVLPHSTADPERLFSIIGKIETPQCSSLLPSTVCDLLSVKLNVDEECYKSKALFTPHLLQQAKTATVRSLSDSSSTVID